MENTKDRWVCIHGHFYQPPRENPWLEAIEVQDSAHPFHDWNERITAECYEPNGFSRIQDGGGRILKIVNNYSRISFNFGPTLLRWMEEARPVAYRRILEADRVSRATFSGHGSAVAQAYNHAILPLCNVRDKRTQILWGIRDFVHRFGRAPEGLWLPEAAVDKESLEIAAELGIAYTILAPHQARRTRPIARGAEWSDVTGARIDPTRAYLQKFPSGRSIAVFFYDGPISRAVAFEQLLASGEKLAGRLTSAFNVTRDWPQLVHIATDGETYGHHHKYGEMALTYALEHMEKEGLARITNYGEFLERFPPQVEVDVLDDTSWSCAHGIERWRSDCGCNGGKPGWHQRWRGPLRQALDGLRDQLARGFERRGRELFKDPWEARDGFIDVVLDRSRASVARFLERHAKRSLTDTERAAALELLEMQRQAMLMYTSCGWFFDELSGIETVQVLHYAGCAIQLGEELLGESLEAAFLDRLERAESNVPEHGNGRKLYDKLVRPAFMTLEKVAAHHAVTSLFDGPAERSRVYSYEVERREGRVLSAGKSRLSLGWARVTALQTGRTADLAYGALSLGDTDVLAGVKPCASFKAHKEFSDAAADLFERADLAGVLRLLVGELGGLPFSIRSLVKDEQQKLLNRQLLTTLREAEGFSRRLYDLHALQIRFAKELGLPLPRRLLDAVSIALGAQLRRALRAEPLDLDALSRALDEAKHATVTIDAPELGFSFKERLERAVDRLANHPADREEVARLRSGVELARTFPFPVDLQHVQNVFYEIMERELPDARAGARARDAAALAWLAEFEALGAALKVALPAPDAGAAR